MSPKILSEDWFVIRDGPARVHKSKGALYGYIRNGVKSAKGATVFLECCLLESGLATSVEAFHRFRRRLNDDVQTHQK